MIQSEWGHDIELKYTYKNETVGEIKTYTLTKEELEKYKNNKNKLLSVKPGLTGYWAAYTTPEVTYEQRINMELYYVDNISLKLDVKIFFKIRRINKYE